MPEHQDWAVAILIRGPKKEIVFIKKIDKKNPRWSLPGGAKDVGETYPVQTAQNKLWEFFHLRVAADSFVELEVVEKRYGQDGYHNLFFFTVELPGYDAYLLKPALSRIELKLLVPEEVGGSEFVHTHRQMLAKHKVVRE